MVTRTQQGAAGAVAALGLAAAFYFWARGGTPSTASADGAARGAAGPVTIEPDLPRIDLARLESPKSRSGAGRRDLFDFGVPPAPPPTPPPGIVATPVGPPLPPPPPTPVPVTVPTPVPTPVVPTPTPLPPLTVRYVGAIEDKRGLKVAVFLTDKEEVLTGQAGQLVGNRFRIVRIGLESVDIQEVGSDQTRRVPLGGK
jgi:hypothetical protein